MISIAQIGMGVIGFEAIQSYGLFKAKESPKWFEVVFKVKSIIEASNLAVCAFQIYELFSRVKPIIYCTDLVVDAAMAINNGFPILLATAAVGLGAYWLLSRAVDEINHYSKPQQDLSRWHEGRNIEKSEIKGVKVEWKDSQSKKFIQCIYLAQTVMSVVLAIFSGSYIIYGVMGALQLYNLYRVTHFKSVGFERTLAIKAGEGSNEMTTRYYFYVFNQQRKQSDEKEECAICFDQNPNTFHCQNHAFHIYCAIGAVFDKMKYILEKCSNTRTITKHYRNGLYLYDSVDYTIKLQKDSLPNCPNCRTSPIYNEVEIDIKDTHDGKQSTVSAYVLIV